MTKYFSIAVSGLTPKQETDLAAEWQGYAWWHGVPNFWLLRDHTDTMTAGSIRDLISGLEASAGVFVLEISPVTWAGRSMNGSNRDWLKKYWPPEGK